MRILLVKMSSLGDIVHTFAAITEAKRAIPELEVEWVVERAFAELCALHPAVVAIHIIDLRYWRRHIWSNFRLISQAIGFIKTLRATHYDLIIDAQGLLKSAIVTRLARGVRVGFDKDSARESSASKFYNQAYFVDKNQHAITRIRHLFGAGLGYALEEGEIEKALPLTKDEKKPSKPTCLFFHGTTWPSKLWPIEHWIGLGQLLSEAGIEIGLLWGNEIEKAAAEAIAAELDNAQVLPRLNLSELIPVLNHASSVIGVDTGLLHLSAALGVPSISIYGPTNPNKTAPKGRKNLILQGLRPCIPCSKRHCRYTIRDAESSPCMTDIRPEEVFEQWQSFKISENS